MGSTGFRGWVQQQGMRLVLMRVDVEPPAGVFCIVLQLQLSASTSYIDCLDIRCNGACVARSLVFIGPAQLQLYHRKNAVSAQQDAENIQVRRFGLDFAFQMVV